jgi:hypothetical protein
MESQADEKTASMIRRTQRLCRPQSPPEGLFQSPSDDTPMRGVSGFGRTLSGGEDGWP